MRRLVQYSSSSGAGVGLLGAGQVIPVGFSSMIDLIAAGPEGLDRLREAGGNPVREYTLLPPVTPSKILCCGVNYRGHLEENPAAALPEEPFFFAKLPSAVIGPDDQIVRPFPECQLDYEVELAVVIGEEAHGVGSEEALDHIFGFTIINDVSARQVQFKDSQITLGKGFNTFCPMGPAIVPSVDMPPLDDVRLTTRVNGDVVQDESAGNTIFALRELIAGLSRHVTLLAGDVVSTGTPAGVAHFRPDTPYLEPGDLVEVEASGIGILRNRVVATTAAQCSNDIRSKRERGR